MKLSRRLIRIAPYNSILLFLALVTISLVYVHSVEAQTTEAVSRERRAQAYAKLLEGQRYLVAARSGLLTQRVLEQARAAFAQAIERDPSLAEAHTAIAEIAFYTENAEQAMREATAAVRIDKDNSGARRILSRLYSIGAIARTQPEAGSAGNNNSGNSRVDPQAIDNAVAQLREVVRLNPKDAEAWALLGEFYFQTNRTKEAIEAYSRWADAPAPLDTRFFRVLTGRELSTDAALARLGEAYMRANQPEQATAAFRRALAAEPENSEYLQLLGTAIQASGKGNPAAVVAELERLVAANPNNTAAVIQLARAQVQASNRPEDAAQTLRAAIARRATDANRSNATNSTNSTDTGNRTNRISRTNRRSPANTGEGDGGAREGIELRLELARILTDATRYTEAIAAYEDALKAAGIGDTPLTSDMDKALASEVIERIAEIQRRQNQSDEAKRSIERLRRLLGSDDPTPDLQLILGLRETNRRAEALEAARAARLRYPEQPAFLRLEAATLADLGQVDEAVRLLRSKLKNTVEDFDDYLYIANIYVGAKRGREAVEAATKALSLAPATNSSQRTQALLMLSSARERAGDARGAEESLRRVLEGDPNNATALNNLGYYLVEHNERLEEALALIQRAVQAEPANPSFLDSLGWAYFKLNRLEEAERHLTEAARRSSSSFTIQEHLGDVYHRLGKSEQARLAWNKALSLAVDAADTQRIKAKLEAINIRPGVSGISGELNPISFWINK